MTNEFLFDMMSEIDFDLIERAEAPVPTRKKPIFRVAMIAAALALVLTVCTASLGVAGTVVTVRYVVYVEQTYPEFDGSLLHFAQILLTEDENLISSLLSEDVKHALGGAIAALRESLGGSDDQSKESTAEPQEDTREPEEDTHEPEEDTTGEGGKDTEEDTTKVPTQTTKPEQSSKPPAEDHAIFVHSSFDQLCMVAGDREIDVFHGDDYNQWRHRVEVTDPEVTHLKFRGWMAFTATTPGTYGYKINQEEVVYDKAFSKEPEDMVKAVSSYMGGKSCSRMEILIPITDLTPGEHKVSIYVKSAKEESAIVIFTLIIGDDQDDGATETEPDITDEPPEQGWSEGLMYIKKNTDGKTCYSVSGIGSCTDKDLKIPPSYKDGTVNAVAAHAFSYNVDLVSVTLPPTVTYIESSGFVGCTGMTEIRLPEKLTDIGSYAFYNCTSLESIVIPVGVKVLDMEAFESCISLKEVVFLGRPTQIGYGAFRGCMALESITLPDSVQSIGQCAFMQTKIKHFVVPKEVTAILPYTFSECRELETVTLYSQISEISYNAFDLCDALQAVYFYGTPEEWESISMPEEIRAQLTPLVVYVGE